MSEAPVPPHEGVSWAALAEAEPTLAEAIRDRFAANRHHVLGTLRPDGAPRLSGIEVRIDGGEVTLGMMPDSQKLADVRRDPRVELHSAPLEDDLAAGDAQLSGLLVHTDPTQPVEGSYFRLAIRRARLVRVDGDELVVSSWRPDRGRSDARRR